MLIRTFKIRSRIVYGGSLGRLQRSYYLTYKDTEFDKVVDNTFEAGSNFVFTVTYSNDNVEGKTVTFTTIDSLNKELGNPDPNYETYSVFVDVLEKSTDTLDNPEPTDTTTDDSTGDTQDSGDTDDNKTGDENTQETSNTSTDGDTNHSDTSNNEPVPPDTNHSDNTDGKDEGESEGEPETENPVILPDEDGYIVDEVPVYPEIPVYPELR